MIVKLKKQQEQIHIINVLYILYFALTIYENVLNTGSSSILKYFGFFLIIISAATLLKKHAKLYLSPAFVAFFVWIIFGLFSLLWSPDVSQGLDYLFAAGNMVFIAFMATSISWNQREIFSLLKVYAYSALLFAIILILGQAGYRSISARYTVMILNVQYDPNVIVAFLVPAALLFLVLMLWKQVKAIIAILAFIVMVYASFLANSRGGLLALAVVMVLFLVIAMIKGFFKRRYLKYFLLILGLIVVSLFIIDRYVDPYLIDRVFHMDFKEGSAVERMYLLRMGWESFIEHPLHGIGWGGAEYLTGQAMHNMYMQVLVDSGLVGLCTYLWGMLNLIIGTFKREHWAFAIVILSMYMVVFFLDSYHAKYLWNIIIFSMILLRHYPLGSENKHMV